MRALVAALGLTAVLGLAGVSVEAQDTVVAGREKELTITAAGEAVGRPDTMIVRFVSEAITGNASDALEQCKSKADAACKAIDGLGIEGAQIVRRPYAFDSPSASNPYAAMQQTSPPPGTKVSQAINVSVPLKSPVDLEALSRTTAKVVDAATKAGVGFATASSMQAQVMGGTAEAPVEYVLQDASALKAKAVADAVSKAKRWRKHLAESGIVSGELRRAQYGPNTAEPGVAYWMQFSDATPEEKGESVSSASPEKVVFQCTVMLSFALGDE